MIQNAHLGTERRNTVNKAIQLSYLEVYGVTAHEGTCLSKSYTTTNNQLTTPDQNSTLRSHNDNSPSTDEDQKKQLKAQEKSRKRTLG